MLKQPQLILSEYSSLYDLIVPKDNVLRKINDLVDFNFIYEELVTKYCPDNGRGAIDPIRMFKYLLLKCIYNISDVDVVERSQFDMSFKYFLDMAPEEKVINPSSLTKFRKIRLKDINLLDMLIGKTIEIALEKEIIKSNSIIVDSTHTNARYNKKSPRQVLVEQSKQLRREVYKVDESIKGKLPKKPSNGVLEDEIEYSLKLLQTIKANEIISNYPSVKEKLNLLSETVEDDLEQLALSTDPDAKVGHKSYDTSFFGYKTNIAMTEERIITGVTVTTGETHDGKQLKDLVEKSEKNGIEVKEVIGDAAYSESDNIEYCEQNEIALISKLSKTVTHGNKRKVNFEYNKDADRYVCPAGHMAIKVTQTRPKKKKDGKGNVITYHFDIEKCKSCFKREGCYKDGAATKTYSVSQKSNTHTNQIKFQNTEYFKVRSRERYKIEAKNGELKNRHGYDVASGSGLLGMQMQSAMTIFAVNLKRIIKLVG